MERPEVRPGTAGTEMEMVDIRTRTPKKWCAGTGRMKITAIADMWPSSS